MPPENGLDRTLAAKMPPRTLALWKRSVLIKLETRTAGEEADLIPRLPSPAILHLVGYLHGGFDRQYPDHLPPNPTYGTGEQFAGVLAQAHQAGDLVMPYTNTTWWCDNPKGPTFEAVGDAPLLVRLDGQHNHEVYGPGSSGWTLSPFHPAVTASVDRLVDAVHAGVPRGHPVRGPERGAGDGIRSQSRAPPPPTPRLRG